MRQRTTAINIRVTEREKRKMETAAKKCGLSLSAYLRKLGLGKEVQATLPQEFYEAYRGLTSLRDNFKSLPDDRISEEVAFRSQCKCKLQRCCEQIIEGLSLNR